MPDGFQFSGQRQYQYATTERRRIVTETITDTSMGTAERQSAPTNSRGTDSMQSDTSVDLSTIKDSAMERLVAERGKLTETLRTFTDDLREMQSASPRSGLAMSVVGQAADRAEQLISYVENREPDQLLEDVRGYARSHPAMFLLGAAVAGGALGRVTRSAGAGAASSAGATSTSETEPTTTAPTAVDLR